MTGVSEMKLVNYKVLKTTFELIENYEFIQGKINIKPEFSRSIKKIDDTHYSIQLGVKISSEKNINPIPFNAEVVISSVFELSNWENEATDQIAINHSTAIMFPYLRTLLSSVTMHGNVPPYMLPIMNISKLFITS